MRPSARGVIRVVVMIALATAVACILPAWWERVRPVPPTPVDERLVAEARSVVLALQVTEPLPPEGYRREFFGEPWHDVDGNGCDTRNDVLAAWLGDVVLDRVRPCLVVSGTLRDPYTGHVLDFVRGPDTSAEVQIDHVVALSDAWRKGAADWSLDTALRFANDPANLIPTEAAANQDKGAGDASQWLPPNRGYHCAYAVQQVRIKHAYGLAVTSEEFAALTDALAACPAPPDALGAMSAASVNLAANAPHRGSTARRRKLRPDPTTAPGERSGRVRTRWRGRLLRHRSDGGADVRVRAAAPP